MKIPYGTSNFAQIRTGRFFYADKTTFLPMLEDHYRHVVFLRPRRFGKSTLVSLLEHYYDLRLKDRFDALFDGLWIHQNPTSERNSYLILGLDFSSVATDRGQEALQRTFFESVLARVTTFILRYQDLIPPLGDLYARLGRYQDADALLGILLAIVSSTSYQIYVLIDEYDHFANRLLASGEGDLYETVVKRTGFVRTFYATLKSGTTTGAVGRMFVTGVSPLMLDDLSSGFNMASHVSLSPRLNTLAGFTRADTERAVDEFLAARPKLAEIPALRDRAVLLDVLAQYYNGYRFADGAEERVFNSDMVLYFLNEIDDRGQYPLNMLDRNVRTEYGHLQRIGTITGASAAERLLLLETIVSEGHLRAPLVEQFGIRSLATDNAFVSLLYFLGMLTLGPSPKEPAGYDLEIPNRVIRELQWEHLSLMLKDAEHVTIHVDALNETIAAMATRGEIEPFLALFHKEVIQSFSNRDLRGLDEKTIKLLLMTYASLGKTFYPLSEREFSQGYGDLFLAGARNLAGVNFSWLLEFKYLKTGAKAAQIEAAFVEAEAQITKYAADPALMEILLGKTTLKAGMLVFIGAKKVLYRPWEKKAPKTRHAKG